MTLPSVTVVIPAIPPRAAMLERALASVSAQTVPASILVQTDRDREGSAVTRNRALARVQTETVVFLDDDDQLMPNAVQVLTEAQQATGAGVVSGAAWIPEVPGHREPVDTPSPGWVDPGAVTARSVLHVSSLIRTDLLREAGGFQFRRCPATGMMLDDYGAYASLAEHGASFWRVPETILIWHHHSGNTSGRGDRWLSSAVHSPSRPLPRRPVPVIPQCLKAVRLGCHGVRLAGLPEPRPALPVLCEVPDRPVAVAVDLPVGGERLGVTGEREPAGLAECPQDVRSGNHPASRGLGREPDQAERVVHGLPIPDQVPLVRCRAAGRADQAAWHAFAFAHPPIIAGEGRVSVDRGIPGPGDFIPPLPLPEGTAGVSVPRRREYQVGGPLCPGCHPGRYGEDGLLPEWEYLRESAG